jgi:glyceraldehyde-3-phosphate dehydrogenase (NAD(P))
MIKVAINGFGTIGRRVAYAVSKQRDMEISGIVKVNPDYVSKLAEKEFKIYTPDEESRKRFKVAGIETYGISTELFRESDVIVDASPEGLGKVNKEIYRDLNKKAIFQGGEDASISDASFNSYASYNQCYGKNYLRVVSCNTTGLTRSLYPIHKEIGAEFVMSTLIRRGADPNDNKKGPINAIEPSFSFPSHQSLDVKTIIHDLNIESIAVKVPTTLMHVHVVHVDLKSDSSEEEIMNLWSRYRRIKFLSKKDGFVSTAQIMDLPRELGRNRSDLYELVILKESVKVEGKKLNYIQAVHQESIVVPENVDAIRAITGICKQEDSLNLTDQNLGITSENLI